MFPIKEASLTGEQRALPGQSDVKRQQIRSSRKLPNLFRQTQWKRIADREMSATVATRHGGQALAQDG